MVANIEELNKTEDDTASVDNGMLQCTWLELENFLATVCMTWHASAEYVSFPEQNYVLSYSGKANLYTLTKTDAVCWKTRVVTFTVRIFLKDDAHAEGLCTLMKFIFTDKDKNTSYFKKHHILCLLCTFCAPEKQW